MTKSNPNEVTPSGTIPNNPTSRGQKGIPFSLVIDDGSSIDPTNYVVDDSPEGYSTIEDYNARVDEFNNQEGWRRNVDRMKKFDPEIHEHPPRILFTEDDQTSFDPVYYPDRYTDTLETEVERSGRQCGGEDVSIDKTKNPEFHATGIVLDGNVSDFRSIRSHKGPMNLITPLTDNEGGMEVIVTKGEIGELVGWDGLYKQWQFNYTLDMVATGTDTTETSENQIITEIINESE